ncbi:MAG: murein biosynthesis integral membrane protein MurJ [Nitriliruptorales bacterium]
MSDDAPHDFGPTAASQSVVASSRRHSALVAAGIFASRVSGLVREGTITFFFGNSFVVDAFTNAFKIPNFLQNLLGEGVLSASFIPVYSRLLAEGREEDAGRVAGAIAGLLGVLAGGLVLAGVFLARPLTRVIAPGLPAETFELTVTLMRLLFPAIGLLVLSAWCLGVLNSHRRFFLSYVAPVLLNAAQIAFLVGIGFTVLRRGLAGEDPIPSQADLVTWLAVGTIVGAGLQFLVQLPSVVRLSRGLRPSLRTDLPGVRHTLRAFVPIVGGRGVVQLSVFVDLFLASFLAAGAIAALRFGQVLYVLPISLFGMSVAAAELPALSSVDASDRAGLQRRLDDGLGRVAFFVVPTALGFLVIGDLLVGALYQRGEFGRLETVQVWLVLAGYTVGLLASTASRLLQSALYGMGDPRSPAVYAAVRVVVSAAFGALLMLQLDRVLWDGSGFSVTGALPAFTSLPEAIRAPGQQADLVRLGAVGLAVAAGAASWLEYRLLRRRLLDVVDHIRIGGGELRSTALAAVPAGLVALASRAVLSDLPIVAAAFVAVAATGATYVAVARALGHREAQDLVATIRRRLRR